MDVKGKYGIGGREGQPEAGEELDGHRVTERPEIGRRVPKWNDQGEMRVTPIYFFVCVARKGLKVQ